MSRCFPFPPPGYERKHNPEDLDLLKEAKRKEKKHKKEKKDKERKKDKEKEKDGSDVKHKEKKDRKEKHKDKKDRHRDKKKDKEDRGKEKDKSSISEESTVAGKAEEQSGGKLHPKGDGKDSNFILLQNQNGGKLLQSNLSSQGIEDSKFVQELDRRIREEKKCGVSQLPERVGLVDKKDQEMSARAAVRNSLAVLEEEKNDNENKKIDRKMDPQGLRNDYSGETLTTPIITTLSESKVGKISRPLDGQNGRRLEDKEKYKETIDINRGNKENNKESHSKEKDGEKSRLDRAKLKSENKKSEQGMLNNMRNSLGDAISGAAQGPIMPRETSNNLFIEANNRKRKDMDTNGFLHESEIRPNKMQKPGPHRLTENGRKSEGLPTPSETPNDKHAIRNSVRVDKRDQLANGMVESHRPSLSKPKSSTATMASDEIAKPPKLPHDSKFSNKVTNVPEVDDLITEASRRPPHPDSKYLAEVLTVPKMVDCSDVDEEDWLFSKKSTSTAPRLKPAGAREDPSVWAEAVHIESIDVCALPYVIPY